MIRTGTPPDEKAGVMCHVTLPEEIRLTAHQREQREAKLDTIATALQNAVVNDQLPPNVVVITRERTAYVEIRMLDESLEDVTRQLGYKPGEFTGFDGTRLRDMVVNALQKAGVQVTPALTRAEAQAQPSASDRTR